MPCWPLKSCALEWCQRNRLPASAAVHEALLKYYNEPMPTKLDNALSEAARNGLLDEAKHLLEAGADPKAGNSYALRCAASAGHLEIVKLLLPVSDTKADDSLALQYAAQNGHLQIVKLLLPVSDPKSFGSSALRYAAGNGYTEIVKLLLPSSDITKIMLDSIFIQTSACDFILSCLSLAKVKEFLATHPSLVLPRARALLASDGLQQRPATSRKVATQRHRA